MSNHEAKEGQRDREEAKSLTITISLEGPAELLSWMRANAPHRVARRLADALPADFKKHMRAARREQLLAVRSLLNAAIALTEREEAARPRSTKIEIE